MSKPFTSKIARALATVAIPFLVLFPVAARSEFMLSLFSGVSAAEDGNLQLQQPGGTALTFHDVSYDTDDFGNPPYYGYRLLYFPGRESHWGFGLEFFHSKIYLDTTDTVAVTGTRGGVAVNANEPLSATFDHFSCSHGLNYLTADVMYRWFLGERDKDFLGRFQPYVGAGVGITIPHLEVRVIGGSGFEEYQVAAPATQAFAGISFDLSKHWLLFTEYKFTYANLGDLSFPEGTIELDSMAHHLVFGVGLRF